MDGDEITGFAGRRQPRGVDVQSFIAATEQIQTLRSESTSFTASALMHCAINI